MALDRGALAKIDRRVFSELVHTGGVQAVKVPLSDAAWSTWRRYCEAIGLSMGEAVAGLIGNELKTVVAMGDENETVFNERVERRISARTEGLDARERDLDARAEQLGRREEQLRMREHRIRPQSAQRVQRAGKVGRNELCPCGSGLKYKHCHGLPGRIP